MTGCVLFAPGDVAEHVCNEPLYVRIDSAHVRTTSQSANLRYAVNTGRHLVNRPGRYTGEERVNRSRRVHDAMRNGWDPDAYAAATKPRKPPEQQPLF